MPGISSTIRLTDAMTPILVNITRALHATLNAFETMQIATSAAADTTAFDGMRTAIQAADVALAGYQERIQNLNDHPPAPPVPPSPPTPSTPVWQNINTSQIFMANGSQRFTEEINAVSNAMRQVLQTQQQISAQASTIQVLPSNARNDINNVEERVYVLQAALMEISQTPLYLRTDAMNNQIESVRVQMQQIGQLQSQLNGSLGTMDTAAANASLQQLNSMLESVTRQIRDINTQQIKPPWQGIDTSQIFTNTGAERFTAEINAANQAAQQLIQTQQQISAQASTIQILPSNARNDINNVEERVYVLQAALMEISQTPLYLRTDAMNNQIESIRQQFQRIGQLQSQLSSSVINMDTTAANASLQQLNSMLESVTRQIRDINTQQINPVWQSSVRPTVFTNTGGQRFTAETNAANSAMQQVLRTQQQITAMAQRMRVIPPGMLNDIAATQNRIQMLTSRVQQLNQIPVNLRTNAVNNQIETLRQQIAQATQAQDVLNNAMRQADISAANAAYQQLNAILDATERNIRDNINTQEQFNGSIRQGTVAANGLENMIRRYVGAFLGFAGVKKVLDLSDTLTQSTARINMMTGGLEDAADVQDKIFGAAQRARGSYQGMLDMVGSFGVRAKAAFSNSDETIQFAENVNKMYAIAGTKQHEAAGATLQLTQALGSGVLRGQELNSVFAAAPNLIQTVADYMNVDIGKIRELAAEGEVSASVVKNAILAATNDINEQFANMPVTFGQVMNDIANRTLKAFEPVLQRLGALTETERFQKVVDGIVNGLANIATMAIDLFDIMAPGVAWVIDNWSKIAPVIGGVAGAIAAFSIATTIATVVTKIFSAALWANPLTWIAIKIGIIIGFIIKWIDSVGGLKIAWLIATDFIMTQWDDLALKGQWLWMQIQNVIDYIVMGFSVMKTGVLDCLGNMKVAGLNILQNFINGGIDMINDLINAVNRIAGTSFELIGHVQFGTNAALEEAAKQKERHTELNLLKIQLTADIAARQADYNAALAKGMAAHAMRQTEIEALKRQAANPAEDDNQALVFDPDVSKNTRDIADSTHDISDSLEITNEDLKYLKDIAEREAINRFTTAEIKVDLGGVINNVNQATDLDGMVDYLTEKLQEQMLISAAGVH